MLFVHKKSAKPIDPWPAVRHGGINNLDPAIKGKYLVLFRFDIVQREGLWHYIFEFDVRDSLRIGALAQLVGREQCYPDDMNWKQWLGPEFTIISASVREEFLKLPQDEAHTSSVITGMREVRATRPVPGRDPDDWFQGELPENFLIAPPDGR